MLHAPEIQLVRKGLRAVPDKEMDEIWRKPCRRTYARSLGDWPVNDAHAISTTFESSDVGQRYGQGSTEHFTRAAIWVRACVIDLVS